MLLYAGKLLLKTLIVADLIFLFFWAFQGKVLVWALTAPLPSLQLRKATASKGENSAAVTASGHHLSDVFFHLRTFDNFHN